MPLYLGNTLISGQSRPIDNTVTQNSNNLITSGAVKTYVDDIATNSDVFIATYGTTTSAEIEAAYQAGKAIYCRKATSIAQISLHQNASAVAFWSAQGNKLFLCIEDVWSTSDYTGVAKHSSTHATGGSDPITPENIGAATASHTHSEYAPAYTYGTADLTAGTSELATGKLYFVYE